jgi:RNA polymerase sigma-70 factor (ECF subfamily)
VTDDPSSEQAWRELLELLTPIHDAARASARRMALSCPDGDDLFQEAVLKAVRKLPQLRDRARFGAWFYAVMLSVHRSRARRTFWKRLIGLEAVMVSGAEPASREQRPDEESRQANRLSNALARLPAVQREAIVLHELDGYTMEEIAAMQRVSVSAVKTRVARGRARLRAHYERLGFGAGSAATGAADTGQEEVIHG